MQLKSQGNGHHGLYGSSESDADFKRPGFRIRESQSMGRLDYRQRLGLQSSAMGSRTILARSDGANHTPGDTRS